MSFEDKRITIIDISDESFGMQLGPETHYVSWGELQHRIAGNISARDMLLNNIAVSCALGGIDLTQPTLASTAAFRVMVAGKTFKGPK